MKKKLAYLFCLCILLSPMTVHAITTQENPDVWYFHNEPAYYDLTYEEALACVDAYFDFSESFKEHVTTDSVVSASFTYVVTKQEGVGSRYWKFIYHVNGSPYNVWQFWVDSPSGETSCYPHFSDADPKEEMHIMTDTEAIESGLPNLLEQFVIPTLPEGVTLHHYEVEDVPPEQYLYYWTISPRRVLPVHVFFSNEENELYEHLYYINILYAYFMEEPYYQITLHDSDAVINWRLDSPIFGDSLGWCEVKDIYKTKK